MDFMPLRLNSSSFICSICALAAIILQLVAMECQKLYMVDSPILIIDTFNRNIKSTVMEMLSLNFFVHIM